MRHIEAYRRRDVPKAMSFLDTDILIDTTRVSGSIGTVSHGHEGVVQAQRRFMGAFEDYAFDIERITDLGGGTIAVVVTEVAAKKAE